MTLTTFAPRFEVRISGLTLAADLAEDVLSLSVETDLDLAGSFTLVLRNPDNALLDSALLDTRQDGGDPSRVRRRDLEPAFLGEIAAIEPSFPSRRR